MEFSPLPLLLRKYFFVVTESRRHRFLPISHLDSCVQFPNFSSCTSLYLCMPLFKKYSNYVPLPPSFSFTFHPSSNPGRRLQNRIGDSSSSSSSSSSSDGFSAPDVEAPPREMRGKEAIVIDGLVIVIVSIALFRKRKHFSEKKLQKKTFCPSLLSKKPPVEAVRGVSLKMYQGEITAILGERRLVSPLMFLTG